jgi:nitrous oxide reductase accessory protein NosL
MIMKKLLLAAIVGVTAFACGPSNDTTTDTPVNISSSPTGDTAITDGGTGAAKGAEGTTDSTANRTDTSSTSLPDTTSHP